MTIMKRMALEAFQHGLDHDDYRKLAICVLSAPPDETKWRHYSDVHEPEDGQWFFWRDPNEREGDHVDRVIVTNGVINGKYGCGLHWYTHCQPCVFDDEVKAVLSEWQDP